MLKSKKYLAVFQAILAAALFGISAPVSKHLMEKVPPMLMAALLYLGAGFGMFFINIIKASRKTEVKEAKISQRELPYAVCMVILDIAAPILLMLGLTITTSANASLLNNFEIVATSLIALLIFKEDIGKRLWVAISLITLSSIILSVSDFSSFSFSTGSILVLLACICWGLENNCTRMMSLKDPTQIVVIKGFGSGFGSLTIAFLTREYSGSIGYILLAMLLGFFAFGLSIFFYVTAQRELGAARTSAYYAVGPFIGVGLSFVMYKEQITTNFIVAAILMIFGAYYTASENHNHEHVHEVVEHEHRHNHGDGHHNHAHEDFKEGEHSHVHNHEKERHSHSHRPDMHHSHSH